MSRKKQPEKNDAQRLFGISLSYVGMDEKCLLFIETCIDFLETTGLETQGLFRMCGSKCEIDELKERADEDIFGFSVEECKDPHSVAGLLKQYFRELPDPLIPFVFYRNFIEAASSDDNGNKKEKIKNCLNLLPTTNMYILGKLCLFMYEVQVYKETNLMGPENLSTCIAPNLLRTEENISLALVIDSVHVVSLFTELIKEASWFFADIEKFRPNINKRKESLGTITKQTFTVYLPPIDKKSIIINPVQPLSTVLEKLCTVRKIKVNEYIAFDGAGNIVSLDKPLGEIDGRCITLISEEEIKRKLAVVEETSMADGDATLNSSMESQRSPSKNSIYRSVSLPKPSKCPNIPKLSFSPRSLEKSTRVSTSAPSSQRSLSRTSLILSPRHVLISSRGSPAPSSEGTPRPKKERSKSYRETFVESSGVIEFNEADEQTGVQTDTQGPPPPLYVPASPPYEESRPIIFMKSEKQKSKRGRQRPESLVLIKTSSSKPKMELFPSERGRTFSKLTLSYTNKENQKDTTLKDSL